MPEARYSPQTIEDFQPYLYIRNQFLIAGTDNFTTPPAQNQDAFEQLFNVLPPMTNSLKRRFGYSVFFPKLDSGNGDHL